MKHTYSIYDSSWEDFLEVTEDFSSEEEAIIWFKEYIRNSLGETTGRVDGYSLVKFITLEGC